MAVLAGLETTIIGDIEYHCEEGRSRQRNWRTKAEESIGMLFAISNYLEAACAVHEAARALGLTGYFPVVDQILNSVETDFRSLPLNQVR